MDRTETWAERLGWSPGSIVVIFHIDDAGMTHSSNLGAIEGLEKGLATSVSVMTPCPWMPEMAGYLKAHPGIDAGVHLTLNSDEGGYRWGPLAGGGQVPGLVDPAGYFWPEPEQVVGNGSPEEVELELRAQLQRAEQLGITVTHLDTHMGVLFRHPKFFEAYFRLGAEKGIPILVAGGHSTYAAESNPEAVRALSSWGEQIWGVGLPVLDDIHALSYDWPAGEKKGRMIRLLKDLKPGITEIISHATRPTDEFEALSDSGPGRLVDLQLLLDPDVRGVVEERGMILATWRELMERRAAV